MEVHKNAPRTPRGRAELVRRVLEDGQSAKAVASASGVSVKTVKKWVGRFQSEGVAGLKDRSSRPHRLRHPTSPATVSRVLRRAGLSRLRDLEPAEPVRRYRRACPGELIHLDIKKLGRFDHPGHRVTGNREGQSRSRRIGREFVHVCIDDASRVAFSQILPDEKKHSAVAFLRAAVAY